MADTSTDSKRGKEETIDDFLKDADPALRKVLLATFDACAEIADVVRATPQCEVMGSMNSFGDEQLNVDILCNEAIFKKLRDCGCVETASSEEVPTEEAMGGEGFSVAFDPLDGSSVIGTNFSVGTILGIWPGPKLKGVKGSEMAAAVVAVYGPRTIISLAMRDRDFAHEFSLLPAKGAAPSAWIYSRTCAKIKEGKLFAPGNLRGTQDNEGYGKLVSYWMTNKYTLRYTGGMVPDVNQLLIKQQGIFVNPSSPSAPAKLRLLYEVAPFAFLVHKAGGISSDGRASILDIVCEEMEQRTQVALGSEKEVRRFDEMVGYAEPYKAK